MSTEFKLRYHNSFIDVEFPAVEEGLHARAQSLSPHRKGYNHDLWDEHDQERLEQEPRDQSYVRCLSEKLDFLSPESLKTPSFTTSEDPSTFVEKIASQSPQDVNGVKGSMVYAWQILGVLGTQSYAAAHAFISTPATVVMGAAATFVMRRIRSRQQTLTRGREKSCRTCTAKRQLL